MIYLGTYHFGIDSASRITVPARFREAVGAEVILLKAPEACLYLYDTVEFTQLLNQLKNASGTPAGRERLRHFYADCTYASVDRTGRFTIPADFTEYAGIQTDTDIVILGVGNHMEIWSKATFADNCPPTDTLPVNEYPDIIY